jgi:hypothetical protein
MERTTGAMTLASGTGSSALPDIGLIAAENLKEINRLKKEHQKHLRAQAKEKSTARREIRRRVQKERSVWWPYGAS